MQVGNLYQFRQTTYVLMAFTKPQRELIETHVWRNKKLLEACLINDLPHQAPIVGHHGLIFICVKNGKLWLLDYLLGFLCENGLCSEAQKDDALRMAYKLVAKLKHTAISSEDANPVVWQSSETVVV